MFTAGWYFGFGAFGLATRNAETLVYLAAMALAFALIVRIDSNVGLSSGVLFGLSMWGLLHMIGGLVHVAGRVVYAHQITPFLRYDQAVHAFGFGFGTLAAWQALQPRLAADRTPTPGLAVIIALAGMGVGAVNEVIEFIATRVQEDTNVGGYVNTGWDLVYNAIGATAASVWIFLSERRPMSVANDG